MSDSASMVERVAKALYVWDTCASAPLRSWDDPGNLEKRTYRAKARAIIATMRHPSEWMICGGALVGPDTNQGDFSFDDAKTCWQAMIDAALAE